LFSAGIHPKEINQFLSYDWEVECHVKCNRKSAEQLAAEILARDTPPCKSEILQILNLWKFKSIPYRKDAMPT